MLSGISKLSTYFASCGKDVCTDVSALTGGFTESLAPGAGTFNVEVANGQTIEVFYYLPPDAHIDKASVEVMFVMHGIKRNASDYFNEAMASGDVQRLGVFLLVPSFSSKVFPKRAGYNFGNLFTEDASDWLEEGNKGAPPLKPLEASAFMAVETVFSKAMELSGCGASGYTLFGHSAGAQFAHRFGLFYGAWAATQDPVHVPFRAKQIVCANAGWWTMPTWADGPFSKEKVHCFPYGLEGLELPMSRSDGTGFADGSTMALAELAKNFVQLPIVVMLGEDDVDPYKPSKKFWHQAPGADEWGMNRLERGSNFFAAGKQIASYLGVELGWKKEVIPNVGHHGGLMTAVAIRHLFGDGQLSVEVFSDVSFSSDGA